MQKAILNPIDSYNTKIIAKKNSLSKYHQLLEKRFRIDNSNKLSIMKIMLRKRLLQKNLYLRVLKTIISLTNQKKDKKFKYLLILNLINSQVFKMLMDLTLILCAVIANNCLENHLQMISQLNNNFQINKRNIDQVQINPNQRKRVRYIKNQNKVTKTQKKQMKETSLNLM